MKKVYIQIQIYCYDTCQIKEKPVTVMGWEFLPGLVIHRSLEWTGEKQTKDNYWSITHKNTGLGLYHSDLPCTRKAILGPAIKFLGRVDWTWEELSQTNRKHAEALQKFKKAMEELLH